MGRAFEVRKQSMAKTGAAKSKLYARYGKEILVAAKSGIPDPEVNVNLKRVIDKAKREQVPADIIKRAIDKAKGGTDENYTSIRYEAFGPGGSLFIIECLSDNANRTIAEVRNCFTKTGGKVGVSGSVLHQFNYQAVFAIAGVTEEQIIEILIENDLDFMEIEADEEGVSLYAEVSLYHQIKTALLNFNENLEFVTDEIMWVPITETEIVGDDVANFEKLMTMLDEVDDVQEVYHNASNM